MSLRQRIEDLIHDLAFSMDEERFDRYLASCSESFEYTISVDTPELGREAVWLHHDKAEMRDLFKGLRQHIRLQGQFLRQLSSPYVEVDGDGETATARTTFLTIYTELDGVSRVYAAGRYDDVFQTAGDSPLLAKRIVRLQTRDLGPGSHLPL